VEVTRRTHIVEIDILVGKFIHGAGVGQDETVFRVRENDCQSGRSSDRNLDSVHLHSTVNQAFQREPTQADRYQSSIRIPPSFLDQDKL